MRLNKLLAVLVLALVPACSDDSQPAGSGGSSAVPQCTQNQDCPQPTSVCQWADCVQGQCVDQTIAGCTEGSGGSAGSGGTSASGGSAGTATNPATCTYDGDCEPSTDACMKVSCLQGLCVSMDIPHCGEDAGAASDAGGSDAGADSATPDSATPDSGNPDSGNPDGATPDSGNPDSGNPDSGNPNDAASDADNAG